ncbi:MAG: hypothetical protein H8F28_01170 [Fibrella sp.]|nr:hypothetical protein [Armatimonadota bacterium]
MSNPITLSASLPTSLRARMTLVFATWFTLIATLACVFFVVWSRRIAHDDVQERVNAAARLVAQERESVAPEKSATKAIREAKEDMRLDNVALFIVDQSGDVLGANRASSLSVADMRRHGWLISEVRSLDVTVIAGMDWRATEEVLRRQALLLSVFALLISSTGSVAAWFLVGSTLRPIGVLAEEAGFASADPLHARLRAPSDDAEVRHLVGTLNDFLERFQESTRAREQFYAAAAHELRTPLAVLSGSIELALSRPRAAADYAETLQDLQRETKRLVALAEGLLTLNRLQTSIDAEEAECVDITDECERILATLRPLVSERDLEVTVEWATATAEVFASRSHLVMLLRNLIENAAKYAEMGGRVHIHSYIEDNVIHLSVYNEYTEAANLPLERIYEPFFRADPSRSVATGGNGLGLAISRRLADAHGWHLRHLSTNGGVLADVAFPGHAASYGKGSAERQPPGANTKT